MPGTRRNAMPRPMPQAAAAAALRAVLKRCSTLVAAAAATLSVCGRLVGAGPAVRFRFN